MSIELAWTLLCLLGISVSVWGVRDANASVRVFEADGNGYLDMARGHRRAEIVRGLIHVILLTMGLPAALNPEPVRFSLFVAELMAVNVLLVLNSLLDLRLRLSERRKARVHVADLSERLADAAERTADATEKIADQP